MTYQERVDVLRRIWEDKIDAFSKNNKAILEMEGFNIPKLDRNAVDAIELKEATENYNSFLSFIKEKNIDLSKEVE